MHMGMMEEGIGKEKAVGNHTACQDNGPQEDQLVPVLQKQSLPLEVDWPEHITFGIQRSRRYEEENESMLQVDQLPKGIQYKKFAYSIYAHHLLSPELKLNIVELPRSTFRGVNALSWKLRVVPNRIFAAKFFKQWKMYPAKGHLNHEIRM